MRDRLAFRLHRARAFSTVFFGALAALLPACDNGGLLPDPGIPFDLRPAPRKDFGFEMVDPTCVDGQKNGAETDVDCGGACSACLDGKGCIVGADCQSHICAGGACVSCEDRKQNGGESDVDCGGGDCAPCDSGKECFINGDCASSACISGVCSLPVSCSALRQGNPATPDGTYTIDPDGPGGAAPFQVFCDMTYDKGGWTALPLAFADPKFWSVKVSGTKCTDGPTLNSKGYALSFQSSSDNGWSYVSFQFVPPIRVTQVYFKGLLHSTASQCNNMDLTYQVTPASTGDTTAESWYFAGGDPTAPVGYVFAAGCNSPGYSGGGGNPAECSMNQTDADNMITRSIPLSKPTSNFQMVAVQGCQSSICDAKTGQAERFLINHPPTNGAIWRSGILVR